MKEKPFDAIVVGSGFAGAVTACRLAEAGLRVCILERGRRYQPEDFPIHPEPLDACRADAVHGHDRLPPDFGRMLWGLGHGLWDVRDLGDAVIAQAAGYGGGSLIYANVHLRAPADVFDERWLFARKDLDPYYDLAAYMLDVTPMPADAGLARSSKLRELALQLGDRVAHFPPPLAVRFTEGESVAGIEQPACIMCGGCSLGCPTGAKTTLDRTYLALAEQAVRPREEVGEAGERRQVDSGDRTDLEACTEVRTLCEVISIVPLDTTAEESDRTPGYRVVYRDLLEGGRSAEVRGSYVFLCAGAINTTELLLQCRQSGDLPNLSATLGSGYFPNADELAVVFDCDDLQEVDRGPTITESLLYRRAGTDGEAAEWLLVQDGGVPESFEPVLGIFRSPLWLGRNRFREVDARAATTFVQRPGYAELPFETLAEAIASFARTRLHRLPPLAHEVGEVVVTLSRGLATLSETGASVLDDAPWRLLPEQMARALRHVADRWLADMSSSAATVVADLLDQASTQESSQRLVERVAKELGYQLEEGVANPVRLALQAAVQLIWGSEADLARTAVDRVLGRIAPGREAELLAGAAEVVRWALDYRLGNGRTAILLALGRDSAPGRLELDAPAAPAPGSCVTGEPSGARGVLVATDLDGGWRGEESEGRLLLTNLEGEFADGDVLRAHGTIIGVAIGSGKPLVCTEWKAAASPRGGVDLTDTAGDSVPLRLVQLAFGPTPPAHDPFAFRIDPPRDDASISHDEASPLTPPPTLRLHLPPRSACPERATQERLLRDIAKAWRGELRTNPASTLMQRRVSVHSQGGCRMARSAADGVTDVDGQVFGHPGLYVMDAAAFPGPVGVNPSATIAAVAERKIETFIRRTSDRAGWQAPQMAAARAWANDRSRRAMLDPIPTSLRSKPPATPPIGLTFTETMRGHLWKPGRRAPGGRIETDLHASITDLAAFLAAHDAGHPEKIPLTGSLCISQYGSFDGSYAICDGSFLQLFVRSAPGRPPRETRQIRYELRFHARDGSDMFLRGVKHIRDDTGFDVWEDTTTLRLFIDAGDPKSPLAQGFLRLGAEDFFSRQIPSFRVNTEDPQQQIWAMSAFARFFFGHLVDVYVPELDRAVDVVRELTRRPHG